MPQNRIITINGKVLTIDQIADLVSDPRVKVSISNSALAKVKRGHKSMMGHINGHIIYGINTGFGPMASHILGKEQLLDLQTNLIRSHSTGMGKPIDQEFVLASMLVRLNTLSAGYSGVSVELVKALQNLINLRVIPVVLEHGAVGTSGDLVQLAHIALALIGEGEVFYKGQRLDTKDVFAKLKILPHVLRPKEGLALINGTAVMSAIAALLVKQSENLLELAIQTGAWSLQMVQAFTDSFSEELQKLRPHAGQIFVAKRLREILAGSKLTKQRNSFYKNYRLKNDVVKIPEFVQEVYSIRCIPQILGPIHDTIQMVKKRVQVEINSITDNPIVYLQTNSFLHGGNFHGDYISASVDQLKMTLTKLSMLSERRLNFFLNQNINKFLPPFINLKKPGLTLALQGLQFVATSTTAHSQTLSFPQYVHSIPTNGDNQDLVSMGTDAGLIAWDVLQNSYIVVAIEFVVLAQAADYLKNQRKLVPSTSKLYKKIRKILPVIIEDRDIHKQLEKLVDALKNNGA